MKRSELTILLAILIFVSCDRKSEKVVSYYNNGQPEWIVIYNSTSDTTDQTIIGYFENGAKKCVRNIKDGTENGEQIVFFPNGQIETICIKENGIQSGLSKIYFENGQLYAQGNFENGLRQGQWELWSKDGTKFIRNYINDTLNGPTREIRTDGSTVYGQYRKGFEIDEWITKSKDSTLIMLTTYDNGVLNGKVKQYYQTGEIYIEGIFENGLKQGNWKIYSKTGKVDTIEVYRNDTLIGYKIK